MQIYTHILSHCLLGVGALPFKGLVTVQQTCGVVKARLPIQRGRGACLTEVPASTVCVCAHYIETKTLA